MPYGISVAAGSRWLSLGNAQLSVHSRNDLTTLILRSSGKGGYSRRAYHQVSGALCFISVRPRPAFLPPSTPRRIKGCVSPIHVPGDMTAASPEASFSTASSQTRSTYPVPSPSRTSAHQHVDPPQQPRRHQRRPGLSLTSPPLSPSTPACRHAPAVHALFENVATIKGVGPAAAESLGRMGIHTVLDLLFHLPVGVFDWGQVKLVRDLQEGDTATVAVRVVGHTEPEGRRPLTIHCLDSEGSPLDLLFFLYKRDLRHFYLRRFQEGSVHRLQGKVARAKYGDKSLCMSHPEAVKMDGQRRDNVTVEPIYRLTQGLNANKLRDFLREALRTFQPAPAPASLVPPATAGHPQPLFSDWLKDSFREDKCWPTFHEALLRVHNPSCVEDVHSSSKARQRLAFDELLATQLPTALRRAVERKNAVTAASSALVSSLSSISSSLVCAVGGDGHLTGPLIQQLPFQMTAGQKRTVNEIWADMASKHGRMVRLLQGDVGTGKTLCALLGMLRAIEGGWQAAMLAPTEILAFQHKDTLQELSRGLKVQIREREAVEETRGTSAHTDGGSQSGSRPGDDAQRLGGSEEGEGAWRPLRIEVLTSNSKRGKARKVLLEELRRGEIDILIGTHSLLSDEVVFRDLGLTVIDEEHRFGVRQREKLSNDTNVLYMSATPIPRTLLLTNYGDMEVSRLDEAPARDVQVTTSIFPLTSLVQIAERLRKKILENSGEKVFWVLPCIEEKRSSDKDRTEEGEEKRGEAGEECVKITSVTQRHQAMVELLGEELVGMVHGRMDSESKLQALRDFSAGVTRVLVSTSVVEVGVDVPDATVCIVEHAEYFGLSQLHQLRGRIGRGYAVSAKADRKVMDQLTECHCVLAYDDTSPNKEKALQRLLTLKKTVDGFEIAEQDLKLRGPGEVLGNRQSGHKGFRLVDLAKHEGLLDEANQVARAHADSVVRREEGATVEAVAHGNVLEYEGVETLLRIFEAKPPSSGENIQRESQPSSSSSSSSSKGSSQSKNKFLLEPTASPSSSMKLSMGGMSKKKPPTSLQKSKSAPIANACTAPAPSSISDLPPGWTTVTYGDRFEISTPPPSSGDEENEGGELTLMPGTEPVLSTRFSIDDLPIPRVSIDLEAEDVTFIIFDTETTGLRAESERIIQLAAKVLSPSTWGGEEDDEQANELVAAGLACGGEPEDGLLFNAYVDPGFWIPAKITEITGISNEFLFRQRARRFEEVWPDFLRWVNAVRGGKPVVLVAHNAGFDHKMLMFDLRRSNLDERVFKEETQIVGMMDTLAVFRGDEIWSRRSGDGLPIKPNTFRQGALYRYLLRDDLKNAHSAKGDVLGLEALLKHPFVNKKWRSAGSAHVLELGGWRDERATEEVKHRLSIPLMVAKVAK